MKTLSYWLKDLKDRTIPIGFVGENLYRRVIINCKEVFDDDPDLVPAISITPPKGDSYPGIVTRDGDLVYWDIQDSDLANKGNGEIQLSFVEFQNGVQVDNGIVGKSYTGRFRVERSIEPTGEAPESLDDFITEASAIVAAIPQTIDDALEEAKDSGEFDGISPTVEITAITGGHRIAITDADGTHTADVMDGEDGEPGDDGYSPTVSITSITGGHRITITDKNGDHTADIMDGQDGDPGTPGTPGADGVSPTVAITNITGGHTVTITDKNGSHAFNVMDGVSAIDDNAGEGDTDKVWSADKSADEFSRAFGAINGKQDITFVTPEMFGAKGDGETDDSEAIQDMFDSENNRFVFGNKTYRCFNIEVSKPCTIEFNNTKLSYSYPWKTVIAEYMLAFTSSNIKTVGKLTIDANMATSVGLLLNTAVCWIDYLYVIRARYWGVYCTGSQIGQMIGCFEAAQCGFNVSAKAKYHSSTQLDLTDIHFTNDTNYSSAAKDEIFNNAYNQNMLIIDDSGYDEIKGNSSRIVFVSRASNPIVLDESDKTVGTFTMVSGEGIYLPESNYVDGDDGRQVYIPIGGGVAFNTSSLHSVRAISCRNCPIGIAWLGSNYGMSIQEFSTDYVNLPIYLYSTQYSHVISHIYFEAIGYAYQYSNKKTLAIVSYNSGSRITAIDAFIQSSGQKYVYGVNETICQGQSNSSIARNAVLRTIRGDIERIYPYNVNIDVNTNWSVTLDENSPSDYCVSAKGFPSNSNAITYDFKDLTNLHRNQFPVQRFYIHYKGGVGSSNCKIGLSASMISAGYSIAGAVDNVYTIPFASAGTRKLFTILLNGKTFNVVDEPAIVSSISSSSTDNEYPTAKCVYDLIGDVETLLANV